MSEQAAGEGECELDQKNTGKWKAGGWREREAFFTRCELKRGREVPGEGVCLETGGIKDFCRRAVEGKQAWIWITGGTGHQTKGFGLDTVDIRDWESGRAP